MGHIRGKSKVKVSFSQHARRLPASPPLITFHFEALVVSLLDIKLKQTCGFEESSSSVWLAFLDNGSIHLLFFHKLFKTLSTPDAVSKSALKN